MNDGLDAVYYLNLMDWIVNNNTDEYGLLKT